MICLLILKKKKTIEMIMTLHKKEFKTKISQQQKLIKSIDISIMMNTEQ